MTTDEFPIKHYRLEMHEQHEGPQTVFSVAPDRVAPHHPACSDIYIQQADRVVAVMEDGTEHVLKNRSGPTDTWPPAEKAKKLDTRNDWLLGGNGETYQLLHLPMHEFDGDTGLRMACWLRALCEHKASFTFEEMYEAVCNT